MFHPRDLSSTDPNSITTEQLFHLASLFVQGKYPDKSYSHADCVAWGIFNRIVNYPGSFK